MSGFASSSAAGGGGGSGEGGNKGANFRDGKVFYCEDQILTEVSWRSRRMMSNLYIYILNFSD